MYSEQMGNSHAENKIKEENIQRMSHLKSHTKSRATHHLEKSNAVNGLSKE